jgi:hypothetical protein
VLIGEHNNRLHNLPIVSSKVTVSLVLALERHPARFSNSRQLRDMISVLERVGVEKDMAARAGTAGIERRWNRTPSEINTTDSTV